jgi:hypothetical protein
MLLSYQAYHKEYAGTTFLGATSIARWLLMYLGVDSSPDVVAAVLANIHTGLFVLPKVSVCFDVFIEVLVCVLFALLYSF